MRSLLKITILFYKSVGFIKHNILHSVFGVSFKCRHQPTCSEYFYQQVKSHVTIMGVLQAFGRIITCW